MAKPQMAEVVPLLRGRIGTRANTSATSATIRASAMKRRIDMPVIVKGVGPRKAVTITKSMYSRIDVDPTYQRDVVPTEVNDLILALSSGGAVVDPVTLVSRSWASDGKLYVVDGLQRATAYMHLDLPFEADVHEVESIEAERQLFIAMNSRKAVTPNKIVMSWSGPSAALLRAVNAQPDHPMFGRVQWGGGGERIGAVILCRGMIAASSSLKEMGDVRSVLSRLDYTITQPAAKARAALFLRLVGIVFPRSYAPLLPVVALGRVAYERWNGRDPELPPPAILSRLSRINWPVIVPSYAGKFTSIVVDKIKSVWKA